MKFKQIEKIINKKQDWLKNNPEEGKIWLKDKILVDFSSLLYPENVTIISKLLNLNKDYIDLFPNINETIAANIVINNSQFHDYFPQFHNNVKFYLKIISYYDHTSEAVYKKYRSNFFNIVPENIAKDPNFIEQLLWDYIVANDSNAINAFHYYCEIYPEDYIKSTQNYIKNNFRKSIIENTYDTLNKTGVLVKDVFSKNFCDELRQLAKQKALSDLKKINEKFKNHSISNSQALNCAQNIDDNYKEIKKTINSVDESKIKENQIKEKKLVESTLNNLEEEIEKD